MSNPAQTKSLTPFLFTQPLLRLLLFSCIAGLGSVLLSGWLPDYPQFGTDLFFYWLNALPFVVLFLALYLLSLRLSFSLVQTLTLALLLYQINQVKMHFLAEPLVVADFTHVQQWLNHAGLLSRYTSSPSLLLAFALYLGLSIGLYRRPKPAWRLPLPIRLAMVAVLLLAMSSPPFIALAESLYRLPSGSHPWEPAREVARFGLVRRLMANLLNASVLPPKPDARQVQHLLDQHGKPMLQDTGLPPVEKILIILSESYFDPARLRQIEPGQFDLPSFRALADQSFTGNLEVPTYGGLTLRTEFEILTQVDLDLFPAHRYPFFTLTNTERQSLVWDARNLGYAALAIHPNKASFWNRIHAYANLGFEHYLSLKDFDLSQKTGYYVSERNFYQVLREHLYPERSQLVYAVSMENHGPWKPGRSGLDPAEYGRLQLPDSLTENSKTALQQYLFIRLRSQRETVALIRYLDEQPYRSLMLFFGDHLPALHDAFEQLGFDDGKKAFQQPAWFLLHDTHQNLRQTLAGHYTGRETLTATEIGSLLLSLARPQPPRFHSAALRLNQKLATATDQRQTALLQQQLAQLQLQRFYTPPADPHGKAWKATKLQAPEPTQASPPVFCPITRWGPQQTRLGQSFNLQPDGRSAWWLKTDCAPKNARWLLDGQPLDTVVRLPVITAALHADALLKTPGKHKLELLDPETGLIVPIGQFEVKTATP